VKTQLVKKEMTKGIVESVTNVFNNKFEENIKQGNEQAIDEGVKILEEIAACKIKTAASTERIEHTVDLMMIYVNK
jgi:ribosomal protein S17E